MNVAAPLAVPFDVRGSGCFHEHRPRRLPSFPIDQNQFGGIYQRSNIARKPPNMLAVPRRVVAVALCVCSFGCTSVSPTVRRQSFEDSVIFQPRPFTVDDERRDDHRFENALIATNDGLQLHGWYQEAEKPTAVVLYCHGNAGNISHRRWVLKLFREYLNSTILVFDYRGYGRSEGIPSEVGVLEDARAARRWLAKRAGVPESEIVLVGNSLGGAVAVDLAAKDGTRALVLENTFTSAPEVASSHLLGLPTRWLLKNRFDSENKIADYHGPLLQTHGDADSIIPIKLGRRLFRAAHEPKQFVVVPGGGHNDPPKREYVQALRRFLESLPQNGSNANQEECQESPCPSSPKR
jgi:uncharacterized protein